MPPLAFPAAFLAGWPEARGSASSLQSAVPGPLQGWPVKVSAEILLGVWVQGYVHVHLHVSTDKCPHETRGHRIAEGDGL